MKQFLLTLQFLTIVPVRLKRVEAGEMAGSLVFFPVVGLLIGALVAGIGHVFYGFSAWLSATIAVICLIILTGGMHLDGLADTCDAIAGGKTRQEMLEIMRDPHAGVMGVLSIVCVILLKIGTLASLAGAAWMPALILMTTTSRWSLVLAMFLFPYARKEGKAKAFMEGVNAGVLLRATALTLCIVVITGFLKGIVAMAASAALVTIFGKTISHKLGGITGDTLGFLNEASETSTLLILLLLQ